MSAHLVLEDGTIVSGRGFGAEATVFGELVFNTGMTGYQEALTDPSYAGQILMFTYPTVGNYGIIPTAMESDRVWPRACVVREACERPSHHAAEATLEEFLLEHDVPGIEGVDTRTLTVKTRAHGTLKAALTTEDRDPEGLLERVRDMPHPEEENLVGRVSVDEPVVHEGDGTGTVALLDTGVKRNIIRHLQKRFEAVHRFPWDAPSDEVESVDPDGFFLSNGPGDPAHPAVMDATVETIRDLVEKYPTQGICLGLQLVSLAYGLETFKLKFGHRGGNQPVQNLESGRVYITSQNHGFAVDADSCPQEIQITEVNANDGTVEGLRHTDHPVLASQYHPEASPGPLDTTFLFDRFKKWIDAGGGSAPTEEADQGFREDAGVDVRA